MIPSSTTRPPTAPPKTPPLDAGTPGAALGDHEGLCATEPQLFWPLVPLQVWLLGLRRGLTGDGQVLDQGLLHCDG